MVLLVVLVPLGIALFAILMEKLESAVLSN